MKVVKDAEHCILLNYFGLHSKFYLVVTVMTYFDLADPGNPLKEQDMWPFVQAELGKDAVLDMAMPKPKAEVLVFLNNDTVALSRDWLDELAAQAMRPERGRIS